MSKFILIFALRKATENMVTDIVKETAKILIDKYYAESEVYMAEFLASEFPKSLSYEEAFEVYILCMKMVEGDEFYTIKEGIKEAL